ncbi:MAG: type I-E CRISPR-associated protein Cas5/CasD [Thermodesulfobacteriota bacterium]|nr:type I-E CRISPR-associated protein Cas5/CasD [Thermodesulfobacteriota bacterium]
MMNKYLILKLQGTMQAWGTHTYEDYRPTNLFPTRSGIVGLLGACIGIEREDIQARQILSSELVLAVRADKEQGRTLQIITDYHTVLDARKVDGKARKDAILTSREYLCDAEYTIALTLDNPEITINELAQAVQKPHYTPVLGRKSCPLCRPLYETEVEAESLPAALAQVAPRYGTIYSEEPVAGASVLEIRDVPLPSQVREFGKRRVYVLGQGGKDVSE